MRKVFLLLAALFWPGAASATLLPKTEVGDVIVRRFDVFRYSPIFPYYLGHAGIFGQWNGINPQDPADYYEYDMSQ